MSSYFAFFCSLEWLWSFFFFFLFRIFPEQPFQPFLTISCRVFSISSCCNNFFFFFFFFFADLLEAESRFGYSCFVPLNIIIGVDNYTLRNGTEQGK